MGEGKSILDGIPVKEHGCNLKDARRVGIHHQDIVGQCVVCGCPIYGSRSLLKGEKPEVTFSCTCKQQKEEFLGHLGMK